MLYYVDWSLVGKSKIASIFPWEEVGLCQCHLAYKACYSQPGSANFVAVNYGPRKYTTQGAKKTIFSIAVQASCKVL